MEENRDHRTTGRILDIIELLCVQREGLSFGEIAKAADLPKGSLHPLLTTLCRRRFVRYDGERQRYFMGEVLFVLGNRYVEEQDLLEQIRAELDTLSRRVNETVFFGVLSGGDVLYLLKAESEQTQIRLVSRLGFKWGAYGTGFGKALLSQYTLEELQELYPQGLRPITRHTITDLEELARQGEQTRRTGFAYEIEESTEDARCVAAPVIVQGKYLAGISVAVPVFRYSAEKETLICTELAAARQRIETLIGLNRTQWTYN